jgi:rod shape-determining protein MreD
MLASHFNWLTVVITLALALVLELIAMPDALLLLRPEWLVLTLVYWMIQRPDKVGIAFAFGTGLLMDVLSGSYFGMHALALSLVAYLVLGMHKRLKMFPVIQQSVIIFFVAGIQLMIVYTLRAFLTVADNGLDYLWQALISAFVWPILVLVYDRLAYALR